MVVRHDGQNATGIRLCNARTEIEPIRFLGCKGVVSSRAWFNTTLNYRRLSKAWPIPAGKCAKRSGYAVYFRCTWQADTIQSELIPCVT